MHKTMASVASLEKIEIIRSQEFMPSEARLKFLKKMIILGPKATILGPQFCRILVLGPHFWWSGRGPGPPGPPLDPPLPKHQLLYNHYHCNGFYVSFYESNETDNPFVVFTNFSYHFIFFYFFF